VIAYHELPGFEHLYLGTFSPATTIRLVPRGCGAKTAYPGP
jgi:hypothetical protein